MDLDLGAALIRLALGPMLVSHGVNKVWGAGGLTGTTGWFASLGLRPAAVHARVAAATEIVAGVMLVVGLLMPLAGAATVGLMVVAALTDHRGKGPFVFRGGWEYVAVVAVVAVALVAIGPGAWSLDHALGLDDRSGGGWASASAVVGVAAGLLLLATSFRPERPQSS